MFLIKIQVFFFQYMNFQINLKLIKYKLMIKMIIFKIQIFKKNKKNHFFEQEN